MFNQSFSFIMVSFKNGKFCLYFPFLDVKLNIWAEVMELNTLNVVDFILLVSTVIQFVIRMEFEDKFQNWIIHLKC